MACGRLHIHDISSNFLHYQEHVCSRGMMLVREHRHQSPMISYILVGNGYKCKNPSHRREDMTYHTQSSLVERYILFDLHLAFFLFHKYDIDGRCI